ncbi:coiled-coil domain-containing protein 93 [Planococcus citri]|uniref:coiled-coil domain-containing protein 93 n=1 Tax=Planococcus citri TaxID=170843 RepID=UPI0031F8113B
MLSVDEIFKSRGYNVPTFVLDADGKQVKIETREDEEQQLKYEYIVRDLISAGYYRAIIKQISPFDVIVGGMTWCIDSPEIDIEADLLFKDSLSLGQKISLTEKVVVVLPKIKCPHFIEPHQIQGLDFIHIYPVIEWLIQWSDENRKKKKDYLLAYALNQYYKRFTHPQGERLRNLKLKTLRHIDQISEKYSPRRVAKQSNKSIQDLLSKVESTLSEYGLSASGENQKFVVGMKGTKALSQNQIKELYHGLAKEKCSEEKLNFENVEQFFEDLQLKDTEKKHKRLEMKRLELQQEKDRLEKDIKEAIVESESITNAIKNKNISLSNLAEEEKKIVQEIQELIQEHEKLKETEKTSKEFYKTNLNALEFEIQELESNHQGEEDVEDVKNQIVHLQGKLEKKKQELGIRTREVSAKERNVDQIPSRAELSQYQKRFLELYKQVALKHTETKRFVILYNALNDKFTYMEREFNLLNSVHENFPTALSSAGSRDEFLHQLQNRVSAIQDVKKKAVQKRNDNLRTKEMLKNRLLDLHEQKREYISAVKELSEVYKRHKKLTIQLEKMKAMKANEN